VGPVIIELAVARSKICVRGAARANCHTLGLSLGTPGNAPTASMPVAFPHCILYPRDLGVLAVSFGLVPFGTHFWAFYLSLL